tara:strand:- start:88 stop:1119 length:1032 start_codon:yes stop_codon:yes gene_type:complete
MANGINNPNFPAYGFGFDKATYNPYGSSETPSNFRFYEDQGASNFFGFDMFNLQSPTSQVVPQQAVSPQTSTQTFGQVQPYAGVSLPMQQIGGAAGAGSMQAMPSKMEIPSASSTGGSGIDYAANMSPQAMMGAAQGVGGILQGLIGSTRRKNEQIAAQDEYDKILQQYKDLDTSNLYADFENQFTGMENVYEDLTVNRQQAEFERDMFRQQQANIMQGFSAAAGGSGIAGLAQALANQGQIAARQAGASIGAQESRINMLRAQEAGRLQQLERTGEAQAEAMRLAGAERARGLEYRQTATQLGMSQQRLAQANMARARAQAALYGGIGSLAGTAAMAAIGAA